MTCYECCEKLDHINQCISALIILRNRSEHHQLDCKLLQEETQELIRASHDIIREFEGECIKRGLENAGKILSGLITRNLVTMDDASYDVFNQSIR